METSETKEAVDYSHTLTNTVEGTHTDQLSETSGCFDIAAASSNSKQSNLVDKSCSVKEANISKGSSRLERSETELTYCNSGELNSSATKEGEQAPQDPDEYEDDMSSNRTSEDKQSSETVHHSPCGDTNHAGCSPITDHSGVDPAQNSSGNLKHGGQPSSLIQGFDKEQPEPDNPLHQSRFVAVGDREHQRNFSTMLGQYVSESSKIATDQTGDLAQSALPNEKQVPTTKEIPEETLNTMDLSPAVYEKAPEDTLNTKDLSPAEGESSNVNVNSRSNVIVKLEHSLTDAANGEASKAQDEGNVDHPGDAENKKEALLKLLNIPAEKSATITDEELKILTKYVLLNPGVSEKVSASVANLPDAETEKKALGKRKCAVRKSNIVPTASRGRNRSTTTRLASKRVVRRPAHQESLSEDEEEELSEEQTEKYVRLPLEEKLKVLKLKKEGLTNVKIAKKLGLTNSRVWRILQKKKELLAEAKHTTTKKRHRRTRKQIEADQKIAAEHIEEVNGDESDMDKEVKDEMKDEEDGDTSMDEPERKTKVFKTRKDLTLADRKKVIETLEASRTKVKDLARRFGVSTSSISRIKKNKEVMKLKLATADLCGSLRRWRDCKDPELDKVLTKWYRVFEEKHSTGENGGTVSVTNALLREKAHDLALIMGSHYFASDNWIHRWKNRHNVKSRLNLVSDRETFQLMDASIDISVILDALGKQQYKMDEAKREALRQHKTKPEEFLMCQHCGVLISSRRKRLDHQPGCPGALSRKDLTLHEKANVVKQLEEPGITMVSLARKYGVSTSAISRIHKSRVEILARVAEGGKSLAKRKRDRPSKEPEVERLLCDWYREQRDMGIHSTGSAIRDKARDIARVLGKDFCPSESWVFRWRHRHNMTGNPSELYEDEEEEEEEEEPAAQEELLDPATGELCTASQACDQSTSATNKALTDPSITAGGSESTAKPKRSRLPRLIMCEKCGCVSSRKKNTRAVRIRHAKGCPDIRQRNEMTYEDRAKMVHALEEPGATLSSVARQFGVSVSSMSRIRQRKNEILSFTGSKGESKRIRSCKEPEIAEMLYQYYTEKKAVGIHINGPKLKERASMLAREMGREFKVSSGWLGRWRHRYNVFSTPKPPAERELSQASKARKKQRKSSKASEDGDGQIATAQITSSEYDGDGTSVGVQIITDNTIEPVAAPMPAPATSLQPPMFLHRSFHTSWDLITQQQQQQQQQLQQQQQQQQAVGAWVKDLMPSAIATSMGDPETVTYTYGEASGSVLPKPLFHHHPHPSHHNMFEPFSAAAVGYHMALPPGLDASGNLIGRDFLKEDGDDGVVSAVKTNNNIAALSSGTQGLPLPHPGHLSHPLLSHSQTQHTSLPHAQQSPTSTPLTHHHHHHSHPHHHHHHQLSQHHSRQHLHHPHLQQQQQQQQQQQALQLHNNPAVASSSSTPTPEEDVDQQRHLMDALKIMSSFAASKSLGDHVQSALRTIEMTMKNNPRKSSSGRGSYPNMQ